MDQTLLKISLAALMHDIGKFAQGSMEISKQYANDNADQYQPFINNRHSHVHSLYTAAFIEQHEQLLPPQLNSGNWGDGDSFINLAAGHHKPETPLQWMITEADRMSSGLDRATFEEGEAIAFRDFKRTRLLPIFESLGDGRYQHYSKREDYHYRYPLDLLTAGSIFPLEKSEKSLANDPQKDYQRLFDIFVKHLKELEERTTRVDLWIDHFDSLLRTCTSMMPAARVGDVIHDVSLYDHARSTAAFAAALYLYHRQTGTISEQAVRDRREQKFLLITGDFYGIQEFIFMAGGDMKKFRSKLLRGRSFAVSLFSELAADHLLREIGASSLSTVLNAAGKFTLIAPNTEETRKRVATVEQTINDWLFSISFGQSSIGLTGTPCSASDFHADAFAALFDRHVDAVQERKQRKVDFETYAGPIDNYLESFDPEIESSVCDLCGKRPAERGASSDKGIFRAPISSCPVCRDHVMIGTMLVKNAFLTIGDEPEAASTDRSLLKPIFNRYQIRFSNDLSAVKKGEDVRISQWQIGTDKQGSTLSPVTSRPLSGYIPLYRQEDLTDIRILENKKREDKTAEKSEQREIGIPKTFADIAVQARVVHTGSEQAIGTDAIGVLKADVDNLGMLLGCGLPENRFSLSRIATLSRQLDAFFGIYLPQLLRDSDEFRDVYTVFAGGDDLFLIGPWNRMCRLAMYLRQRFADYVCNNEFVTFSAGISVQKSHVPVDKLGSAAEDALEQAKDAPGKDSVTIFGQTVKWPELTALMANREKMEEWLRKKTLHSSMFYRFNELIRLAGREKAALAAGDVFLDDLEAMKWRSMFSYSIHRNINSSLKGHEREHAIADVSLMADWMNRYGAAVIIPLWHLLYDKRT